jgi:hypothetical protein
VVHGQTRKTTVKSSELPSECQCHILQRPVYFHRLLANEIAEHFLLGGFPEISKRARIASEPIIPASRRLLDHTLTTSCGIVFRGGWSQRMFRAVHFSDRIPQATVLCCMHLDWACGDEEKPKSGVLLYIASTTAQLP